MKRFLRIFGIGLIAAAFIGTFFFLYQKSRPKEVVYEIFTAKIDTIERSTVVTGAIEPRNEVEIKPQISGIIAELYKEAGQMVSKGEIIAKVRVIPDMGQLNAAESRVRIAQMNLKQAEADYARVAKLRADQLVSQEELEKSSLNLRQQREELASASDALQIARDGVSASTAAYSTTLIRSTIDGLILDIPVKVGNSVIMSNSFNDGTTIATVANMGDLIFKGSIDETEVARLVKGMPMNITVGALPNEKLSAQLEFIAPKTTTDATGNQFEIKGALVTPSGLTIRSGYSANAEIVLESLRDVLSVPEAAVEFDGDSTFVHILTSAKDTKPQTFERRSVVTGISDGVNIEIKRGLKQGEQVRGNALNAENKDSK
ncbi:MAG: efflux RND transporter periplasmic adaptor subunit [Bacteroidales bacterium]|nr:efflux RND transporter periplasmic adaptor subunit [Bacteroidales bacterium]